MSAARIKAAIQQAKGKPKPVRCRDCENEIRDTEGISFRMSDHSFFLSCCKKGHHIDRYGKLSKLFNDHERICNDYEPKKQQPTQ